MNINTVTVAGRLTRDPEVRHSNSGVTVVRCGFATNRRVKNRESGKFENKSVFIDVLILGKRGEALARHLKKGDPVCFPNAELDFESWEKDGVKRSKVSLFAAGGFEFVGSRTTDVPF